MNKMQNEQSIIFDGAIESQSRTREFDYQPDLKDQIIQFQSIQKNLKKSIIETDVALNSPAMKYRLSILDKSYQKEKDEFRKFLNLYKQLSLEQRRPYETMMRKFKQKINGHNEQIQMAKYQPQQHQKKLENQRQVWFQNQQLQQQEWKFLLRGFVGVFASFLFHLIIGAIGRWALVNPYISSYYKITNDPHIETRRNAIGSPIMMLCIGITMKWGFRRCNQFGKVKVLLIAALCCAASIFGASMVPQILEFFLFHNVLFGLSAGVLFICPMKECHKYFPKYKLVCNSIILAGMGLGAVVFGALNTQCLNPLHQKPEQNGYWVGEKDYIPRRLPYCMVEMSIVITIIGVLASILIYPLVKYNNKEEEIKLQKGQLPDFQNSCYTDQQALKSLVFWVVAGLIVFCSMGNFYFVMNYKNLVKAQDDMEFKNDQFLYLVVMSGGLCNGLFRIGWGIIFRNIGFKYTFILAVSINVLVYSLFISIQITYVAYFLLYTVAAIVAGGFMVIFPNACLLIYGDVIGESIYGFYWATFSFSNFFQYLMGSNIKQISYFVRTELNQDWTPQNIHKLVFYPFIAFSILSIILIVLIKFQGRWQNSLKLLTLKCE